MTEATNDTVQDEAAKAADRAAKNRNLLLRIATAVVLLPVVLWLMWRGGAPFAMLIAAAALMNAIELSRMALGDDALRVPPALAAFALPFFFVLPELGGEQNVQWVYVALTIVAIAWRLLRDAPVDTAFSDVSATVFAGVYGGLLAYLMPLRQLPGLEENSWAGAAWVVLACALTWGNDTMAYVAGRLFGRAKLFPRISPAKTWEGFFGGIGGSTLAAFIVHWTILPDLSVFDCVALGLIMGITGPLGDLAESMLKRSMRVKDSGDILPGHGGMLDRVDALMVNAPILYFWAKYVTLARAAA